MTFRAALACLLVLAAASAVSAQRPLRIFPDGTRLGNDMVTPIYLDTVEVIDDAGSIRLRLRDSSSYSVVLFAERGVDVDLDGTSTPTLRLALHAPAGRPGTEPIEEKSLRERFFLQALRDGLEHYTPGWVKDWSTEGHRALEKLVGDLMARQQAR